MSSRICIKNFSKNVTAQQLKELFSSKGEVTDIKVIGGGDNKNNSAKTKGNNNKSKHRGIAFIGFRTDKQAEDAQKYFNSSFIGLSKISVEIAQKRTFDTKEINPLNNKNNNLNKNKKDLSSKLINERKKDTEKFVKAGDPIEVISKKKQEFLDVMKSRQSAKFWTNDDGSKEVDSSSILSEVGNDNNINDDDNSDDVDEDSNDDGDNDDTGSDNNKINRKNDNKKQSKNNLAAMSNLDYLKSKMKQNSTISNQEEETNNHTTNDDNESTNSNKDNNNNNKEIEIENDQEGEDKDDEESGRLYVRNIPFSCTEEELSSLFTPFGPLSEVQK